MPNGLGSTAKLSFWLPRHLYFAKTECNLVEAASKESIEHVAKINLAVPIRSGLPIQFVLGRVKVATGWQNQVDIDAIVVEPRIGSDHRIKCKHVNDETRTVRVKSNLNMISVVGVRCHKGIKLR